MSQGRQGVALGLLGPLVLWRDGAEVQIGGRRPRAILADLALHLGAVVSIDRLIDDLWGEQPPASAAHALEVHISQLRKALGEHRGLLVTRSPGYALELEPDNVDARRFADLVESGRVALTDGDPEGAATSLRGALRLWRGPALADFAYEPFAQVEIARLEELRQECLEERIEADLALGRYAQLAGELEALVAAEPLRERLRGQLMLALYRAGRQADALAAYREGRDTLVEELGVEPAPELRALEAAILRQDEALLTPVRSEPAPAAPKRKLVAILFADVVDSMQLASTLDPEALHGVLGRYFETVAAAVERHGGTVEKFVGDAVMAGFGVPVAHEDDALRAARAALEAQDGIRALAAQLDVPLEVRIGVESGEVLAGDVTGKQRFVTGEAVGLAARLQESAPPGAVAVGKGAAGLIGHAALLEPLPGDAPEGAARLVDLKPSAPAFQRRLDAPLVGRAEELAWLRAALAGTIAERKTRAVLVVGPAGIGKSRLVDELAKAKRGRVLAGRCIPYGEGITYWPLRTIVPEAELAEILQAPSAGEIAWAFRGWCEQRSKEEPLLLVLDDLHWAEPTFLELVEQLVERGEGRILVVGIAREELLEARPDFLAQAWLRLEPLAPTEIEELATTLLGSSRLGDEARARLVETADGNPLFLEQLLAFAADEDVLGAERPFPGTIQALLAARLDRLGPGERSVLERAAIVGKDFTKREVAELLEPKAAGTAGRHLQSLVARGFVRAREDDFGFRHVLIQEAAYRATPKQERAELHERFADRLGDAEEVDEIAGYHLERAYHLRTELGTGDRRARQLAADAGTRLGAAGLRACKQSDIPAAVNLLGRAAGLLPQENGPRRELLCELGLACWVAGDAARAEQLFEDAIASAVAARDRRVELRARIESARIRRLADADGSDRLLNLLASAIPTLERLEDDRALGRAWLLLGFVQGGEHGQHTAWENAAERALACYKRAGWTTQTCVQQIAAALYYGSAPVVRGVARCEELLNEQTGGASGYATALVFLGGLQAMVGRFDDGRRLISEATETFEQLGQRAPVAISCQAVRGDLELLADESSAAECVLRAACEALARLGDDSILSTRAADLAEALYRQDRFAEAAEWLEVAKARGSPADLSVQPLWRAVEAKMLARRGMFAEAERLAREAVLLADRTEALGRRGRVLLDLAEVLHLAGRGDDAASAAADALALFEQKGNLAAAEQARRSTPSPALI